MYRSYNIAAKVTKYGGNVFSSRLEAKWAVYLDQIGVRYDYEPCYFELPSRNYLPDFWIDDDDCDELFWLEIKPSYPKEFEIELMYELHEETEKFGIILYGDIPNPSVHEDYYEEYLAQTVGQVYVGTWCEETSGCFSGWQNFPGNFPTFNRKWSDVEQALLAAIKFRF